MTYSHHSNVTDNTFSYPFLWESGGYHLLSMMFFSDQMADPHTRNNHHLAHLYTGIWQLKTLLGHSTMSGSFSHMHRLQLHSYWKHLFTVGADKYITWTIQVKNGDSTGITTFIWWYRGQLRINNFIKLPTTCQGIHKNLNKRLPAWLHFRHTLYSLWKKYMRHTITISI